MQISMEWLGDFVALPAGLEAKTVAHDLTMATVEVEGIRDPAADLVNVVVARVLQARRHGTVHVVQCDAGLPVEVVCGADRVEPGMLVALALPGARVRHRGELRTVEVSTVRDVVSHGMLCSADELGLADLLPPAGPRAIIDLADVPAAPGTPLARALLLEDRILEIDNKSLTNRPDLFGHHGIARELAAIYDVPLAPLPRFQVPEGLPPVAIAIEDRAACLRYLGARIDGLQQGPSPLAMRSRLFRVGQRPIGLLVDLSNYVMLAVGQPNHLFSADGLRPPIRIRRARPTETLALLDGKEVQLQPEDLVIADDARPIALAGVMGGAGSSVAPGTTEVLLELAAFEARGVRRTASRLGVRTESSTRFEKGLAPSFVDVGLGYFMDLLARHQPQARLTAFADVFPAPPAPIVLAVPQAFLNRKLGVDLPPADSRALLGRLGFATREEAGTLTITVPSWRSTGDVSAPEDIVEEVARLYGYEKLPYAPPTVALTGAVNQPRVRLERRLRRYLAFSAGMQEILSYPWVEERYTTATGGDRPALRLHGAPAQEATRLKTSLVPGLLKSAVLNLRFADSFRIFEIAPVFWDDRWSAPSASAEALPGQPKCVAGALVGSDAKALFLEAKGVLEQVSRHVQMRPIALRPSDVAPWAERGAQLAILQGDREIGVLGVVSARTRRLAGLKQAHLAIFELDFDGLEPLPTRDNAWHALPSFPLSTFDISMVFARDTPWSAIEAAVDRTHPLIRGVAFVDEYAGGQVEAGHRSLTLRLTIGSADRTLTAEEIQEAGRRAIEVLRTGLGGVLRE